MARFRRGPPPRQHRGSSACPWKKLNVVTPSTPTPTDQAYAGFAHALAAHGVREALAYLVKRTDYRFISIFRFQNGLANAAVFYDREHPEVTRAQEVPDTATYCCYVRDSRGVFTTADALLDARTDNHPARESVRAYCGVPVMDAEGHILGTLCHYDLVPRDPDQIDLPLVIAAASTLALGGHVPPYPSA
jgi:GAF domain-containing protein